MTMLQPMPVISRGVPAYTNDDFSGSFPASHANNATYGGTDYWRCAQTPVSNANSGTLIAPVYLAYDLSGVPSSKRGQVVVVWYDDTPGEGAYDPGLIANSYINQARDYTIDVNPAAGGTLPTSGWVTKATVSGSTYHSRQHVVDMTGNNWIRINVTGIIGSASNNNVALNMDVHDAHLGVQDDWIFYGDSIIQRGLDHDDSGGIGNILPAQINTARGAYFPVWECAGVGGYTATDMQAIMAGTFLPLFPGKYVALPLGTNDAAQGGALITNFQAKMQSMITSVLSAGKIPVIPHIPWGSNAGIVANGPTINGYIDALIAANPGAIAGPDLWTYFNANQTLISGDGIHMTDPAGYAAYRTQWLNWATTNIYFNTLSTTARTAYKVRTVLSTPARTAYKVRTILKTLARTAYKIQLGSAGHQPYQVSSAFTHLTEHPFSTISSKVTVTNASGVLQNSMAASVTVTYPDNSTATPQVYWLGNGLYSITYETKAAGTISEVWTFIDALGSSAEYRSLVPCSF